MDGALVSKRAINRVCKSNQFTSDANGMSLTEVLIAIAILGLVAVGILPALAIFYDRTAISEERTTSEQLAKSQMEGVKSQGYDFNSPPQYQKITGIPSGYFIGLAAARLDPKNDGLGNDDGMQKITVTVYKGGDASGKLLLTVEGYKVKP
jgi:prepilin-type N-terminal cleavage/methylation domain-containing protein